MWITKLDTTYLHVGQYFDILIILLPIITINLAIKKEIKLKKMTFLNRLLYSIGISLVAYIFYEPFLYLYHNSINPSWFNAVLELKEKELIAKNISIEIIQNTLEKMKSGNNIQSGFFSLSSLIPSVIILPTLSSILSYIVLKSKTDNKHKLNTYNSKSK